MNKKNMVKLAVDVLYDIVGSFLLAVELNCFYVPANIAPGGVSGIAVLANYLTGLPIGTITMALNIPLLILAWLMLGKTFTLRTMRTVIVMTLVFDVSAWFLPVYQGDSMLAALFGGVLSGAGLAVVFMRGSTTGGGDIISRLIQKKLKFLPIGQAMLCFDVLVIGASMLIYQSIESGLYALIAIYTSSKVLDSILYGLDNGKMILIISDHSKEISDEVMGELERGTTFLHGSGGYTEDPKKILMSIVRPSQVYKVEAIAKRHDPKAFFIILEANEVQGEGFRDWNQEKLS